MKFIWPAFLAATLLGSAHASAQTTADVSAPGGEAVWTLTHTVTSQYLFRGVRLGGAAYQPSVDYARGALSLGLWASAALEHHESGDADPEIDFYGAYTFQGSPGVLEIMPGFSLYTYPDASRALGQYAASFEPSLAANVFVKGIRLTPKIYYDITLEGATYELTAAYALPLTSLGTELDFTASLGTFKWNSVTAEANPAEKNWGDYWQAGVALPFQISARGKLILSVTYSEGRNNFFKQAGYPREPNEDAIGRAAVTLGYAMTF